MSLAAPAVEPNPVSGTDVNPVPDGTHVWLYEVDAAGYEVRFRRNEEAGFVSEKLFEVVKEGAYDDVVVIVHG
jgi:hypothetical protein